MAKWFLSSITLLIIVLFITSVINYEEMGERYVVSIIVVISPLLILAWFLEMVEKPTCNNQY
jgi:hypothetical protein